MTEPAKNYRWSAEDFSLIFQSNMLSDQHALDFITYLEAIMGKEVNFVERRDPITGTWERIEWDEAELPDGPFGPFVPRILRTLD